MAVQKCTPAVNTGSVNVNCEPLPIVECALNVPWWASAIALAIDKPSPIPLPLRFNQRSVQKRAANHLKKCLHRYQ